MCPAAETFWTIMSMLIPASASGRKTRPATPGWSGTPRMVTFASPVSCATPEMIACSSMSSSLTIHVPSSSWNDERTWSFTPWLRAYSTDRSISTRAPDADSSSISSYETDFSLRAVRDDPRVGREHAVDVGVDLADVRVERGCERDGRRVGAAAAERRHVLVGRDALEAGDDRDLSRLERLVHAAAAHLDDARPAVARVGHDPGLRAGERDRRRGRGR